MISKNLFDVINFSDELSNLSTRIKYAKTVLTDIYRLFESDKPDTFKFVANYESNFHKASMAAEFLTDSLQMCSKLEQECDELIKLLQAKQGT